MKYPLKNIFFKYKILLFFDNLQILTGNLPYHISFLMYFLKKSPKLLSCFHLMIVYYINETKYRHERDK